VAVAAPSSLGVVSADSAWLRVANALAGIALGTAVAYLLIVAWLVSPLSHWYHWTHSTDRLGRESSSHSLLILRRGATRDRAFVRVNPSTDRE